SRGLRRFGGIRPKPQIIKIGVARAETIKPNLRADPDTWPGLEFCGQSCPAACCVRKAEFAKPAIVYGNAQSYGCGFGVSNDESFVVAIKDFRTRLRTPQSQRCACRAGHH